MKLTGIKKFEGTDRQPFTIDIALTKSATVVALKAADAPAVDDATKGDLVLTGYANTWGLDRDGEFIHPDAFEETLPDYLAKNPIVLWMHDDSCPIGQVVKALVDETGLYVEIVIKKPADGEPDWLHLAYNKMAAGVVRTLSIGGYMDRVWVDTIGYPMVVKVELFEISVVSIPANENSIFAAAVKMARGESAKQPRLSGAIIDQMETVLGMREPTDPELMEVVQESAAKRLRYLELAAIYHRAGYEAPELDEWTKAADMPTGTEQELVDKVDAVEVCIVKARGTMVLDQKAGRVISKANQDLLIESVAAAEIAIAKVKTVLGQVADEEEVEPGPVVQAAEALAAGKSAPLAGQPPSQLGGAAPIVAEGADPLAGRTTDLSAIPAPTNTPEAVTA